MRKKKPKDLPTPHPGDVLEREFLLALEISQYRLAKSIQVPARRINEIVQGKRAITADTALRLGLFFGNAPEFWMHLQAHYDLEKEWRQNGERLTHEIPSVREFA